MLDYVRVINFLLIIIIFIRNTNLFGDSYVYMLIDKVRYLSYMYAYLPWSCLSSVPVTCSESWLTIE